MSRSALAMSADSRRCVSCHSKIDARQLTGDQLKCDVQPEPFKRCSRCNRLKLDCRIDANFKRIGKRSKTAQMEKEIVELRKKLAEKDTSTSTMMSSTTTMSPNAEMSMNLAPPVQVEPIVQPHQGVAHSLLDLRNSAEETGTRRSSDAAMKTLGNIELDSVTIRELYRQYFEHYHPFLPILDCDKRAEHYFELSPLLFWTVIVVAARRYESDPTLLSGLSGPFNELLWQTISQVPQNYHEVKSLAILCMWPLPTKSTSTDQTFMIAGLMMQIALQTGLHRPSYAQDFSRGRVDLKEDDIRDRLRTWAVCNIVAQK